MFKFNNKGSKNVLDLLKVCFRKARMEPFYLPKRNCFSNKFTKSEAATGICCLKQLFLNFKTIENDSFLFWQK